MNFPEEDGLYRLFYPRGVAVIGASSKEGKIGYKTFRNLLNSEYSGGKYPVNIKEEVVQGARAYRSVLDIPDVVDLAVIVVPASAVPGVLEDCGKKGVKFAIIITSGYSEIGKLKEERELVEIARRYGMRILGPNVFGIIYTPAGLNASFGPPLLKKGTTALITQSGALGVALMGKVVVEGLGLSAVVSVGNKADISDVDLLKFFEKDPNTRVIFIYMEGTKDGREFLKTAECVVKSKPIVIIKSGRSKKGAQAAASHTGSLAGSDRIFQAAFDQVGILRAKDIAQAFRWIRALSYMEPPEGDDAVIITNGGGIGVMATDASEEMGVNLFDDREYLDKLFRPHLPYFASTRNPVDITGQADEKIYHRCIEEAMREDKISSVIALYGQVAGTDERALAEGSKDVILRYNKRKPAVFAFVGGEEVEESIRILNDAGIPSYYYPEDAVDGLSALIRWGRSRRKPLRKLSPPHLPVDEIRNILQKVRDEGRIQLLEPEAKEIFRLMGIAVPEFKVVSTLRDAYRAAEEIGYPVAVKIVSEDIIHKSDVGGVKLNISGPNELKKAYEAVIANSTRAVPGARIRGALITKMAPRGVEVIVGGATDPAFGPVVMVGLGGIYVEVMKDVSFRVAPVTEEEAREMIDSLRSSPILYGARGDRPRDTEALSRVVMAISHFMDLFDEVAEMDINPLFVMGRGDGAVAVDGRITLKVR